MGHGPAGLHAMLPEHGAGVGAMCVDLDRPTPVLTLPVYGPRAPDRIQLAQHYKNCTFKLTAHSQYGFLQSAGPYLAGGRPPPPPPGNRGKKCSRVPF